MSCKAFQTCKSPIDMLGIKGLNTWLVNSTTLSPNNSLATISPPPDPAMPNNYWLASTIPRMVSSEVVMSTRWVPPGTPKHLPALQEHYWYSLGILATR
jgi:hypothetical protein